MSSSVLDLILKNRECFAIQEKTSIFEIAGFPHYESVSSNLLAFYLDPKEKHGLGDLCLSCLLTLLQAKMGSHHRSIDAANHPVAVTREVPTDKRNRIDILLEGPDYLLLIENKINHKLANDLKDYYASVAKQYPKKRIIGVVLSLKLIATNDDRYINIRHSDLYEEILKHPRFVATQLSNRYGLYLKDYAEAIDRLGRKKVMNTKLKEMLDKNPKDISLFYRNLFELNEEIKNDIRKLGKGVEESFRNPKLKVSEFGYPEYKDEEIFFQRALVLDLKLKEIKIAIDVIRDYAEWRISIFERTSENTPEPPEPNISTPLLEGVLKKRRLTWERKDELKRLIYKRFELEQFDDLKDEIHKILGRLLIGV